LRHFYGLKSVSLPFYIFHPAHLLLFIDFQFRIISGINIDLNTFQL